MEGTFHNTPPPCPPPIVAPLYGRYSLFSLASCRVSRQKDEPPLCEVDAWARGRLDARALYIPNDGYHEQDGVHEGASGYNSTCEVTQYSYGSRLHPSSRNSSNARASACYEDTHAYPFLPYLAYIAVSEYQSVG